MVTANTSTPAWMVCEDIITRLKDELVLEAIDILQEEIKAGRIDIKGYVSLLPDKSDEIQRNMYIINNLRIREHEIMEQYRPYLGEINETDPEKLKRIEDLKKFVLSVGAISTLMRFSEVAGVWAEDTGKYTELKDQERIMISTIRGADDRIEVLEFALSSSRFLKSETLNVDEVAMLRKAVKESTVL
jgi:hypothetical protein